MKCNICQGMFNHILSSKTPIGFNQIIYHGQSEQEPAKELNAYIVRFLDQTTYYMIEKGNESLPKLFL